MTQATVTRGAATDVTVVAIAGDLDFSSVEGVTDQLEPMLAESESALVVDLSATAFLDSAGINLLYDLYCAQRTRGGDLSLVVPSDSLILRSLTLTGADRAFTIHPSLDAATAPRADGSA